MSEKMLFLGDLYFNYPTIPEDFQTISDWISKQGVRTVVNLEGSIKAEGAEKIKKRGPNLACSDNYIEALQLLNCAGACLANNHIMDYGETALGCILSDLEENGIAHCGAHMCLEDAYKPMHLHMAGKDICILNFGWDIEESIPAQKDRAGCAPIDRTLILNQIEKQRPGCDVLIVCLHWGFEYHRLPMAPQIDLAHEMIDSGADLIIGHHPHNVQPKECYKGKWIYYSLGNFYFSEIRKDFCTDYRKELIRNQSDYGIAVEVDPVSLSCKEYTVVYKREDDRSVIAEEKPGTVLEDISAVDHTTKAYEAQVRRRKYSITPVLTHHQKKNSCKLRYLFLYYRLRKLAKRILTGRS